MCQKLTKRSPKILIPANFVKVAAILAIFFFVECAAGSCLSYGHACWGAHGKRSGSQAPFSPTNDETPSNKDEAKTKWFLSKLISPLDLRYYRDGNKVNTPKSRPEIEDLFTDIDEDNTKSAGDWELIQNMVKNDDLANGRNVDNVFKTPKFMIKRSTNEQ